MFREWLSDNLRYIMLAAGILLFMVLAFFGVRAASNALKDDGKSAVKSSSFSAAPTPEEPDVTVTPTVEPTPEPTATATPTPEPTATSTPTPEPTATSTPTPEPTATEVPAPTATKAPEPTATPAPTSAPTPLPTKGAAHTETINSSCNIRKGPGYEYAVIGSVSTGQQVTAYGDASAGWWHITTADGKDGWIGKWFIGEWDRSE